MNIQIVNGWYRLIGQERTRIQRVFLVTLLMALLGGILGLWQAAQRPPLYQVEVTLAVYPTHYRFVSDAHLQTLNRPRGDARMMAMVMAQGPNVLNEVIRRMGDRLPPKWQDREELKRHLVVRGGEGVYAYLTVNARDHDLAYDLARTWAEVTEEEVEKAFYRYDSDIPVLREQMESLGKQLADVEARMEAFRRRTGIGLVDESRVAIIVRDDMGLVPNMGGFSASTMELGEVNGQLAEYRHAQTTLRHLAQQVRQAKNAHTPLSQIPLELVDTLRPVQRRGYLSLATLRALGDDYDAVTDALEEEARALQPAIDFLAAESDRLQADLSANITQLRDLLRQRTAVETLYKALQAKQNELVAEAAVASNYVDIVEIREPKTSGLLGLLVHVLAGVILGSFLGFTLSTTWYAVRSR